MVDVTGRDIAIDFALMISIWLIGMLVFTTFCYGVGGYSPPQYVIDWCTHYGTTPHDLAQFGYMVTVLVGLLAFFGMTLKRRM